MGVLNRINPIAGRSANLSQEPEFPQEHRGLGCPRSEDPQMKKQTIREQGLKLALAR
jgi:hypothetical protein